MTTVKSHIKKGFLIFFTITAANSAFAMAKQLPVENDPSQAPTPTTSSMSPLWESKNTNGKKWTTRVLSSLDTLGADLIDVIPSDAQTFCPKYNSLSYSDRKKVWAYLMSAMVKYESSFNPQMKYTENFRDVGGKYVISRGLLQLSFESSQPYSCGFRTADELHDPELNLDCGIRILSHWILKDGRMAGKIGGSWAGGARYWSVLRTTSKSYASIVSLVKATSLCN